MYLKKNRLQKNHDLLILCIIIYFLSKILPKSKIGKHYLLEIVRTKVEGYIADAAVMNNLAGDSAIAGGKVGKLAICRHVTDLDWINDCHQLVPRSEQLIVAKVEKPANTDPYPEFLEIPRSS